jgi:hypothetical protein
VKRNLTTPGLPQHKKPEVALVTAGVEMDVLGLGYLDKLALMKTELGRGLNGGHRPA